MAHPSVGTERWHDEAICAVAAKTAPDVTLLLPFNVIIYDGLGLESYGLVGIGYRTRVRVNLQGEILQCEFTDIEHAVDFIESDNII